MESYRCSESYPIFSEDELRGAASNPDVLQFTLRKKNKVDCIPAKDPLYSNSPPEGICQAYDKARSSAVLSSSLSRNFETLPELYTFRKVDLTKAYKHPVSTAYPKTTLPPTNNLSKETSVEKDSVSQINPVVKNASTYGNSLPQEAGPTGINSLSFSQEIGSIGKILAPKDISKSVDATQSQTDTSGSKLNPNILDGHINVSNVKKVFPLESSASPIDKPNFETDASLFVHENIKIPECRHESQKNKQEENPRRFESVNTKEPYDDRVITRPSTSGNHLSLLSNGCNKSNKPLKDILLVLEDWAKRGLDYVFNRPAKFSSEEIGTNLEKGLEYGLDIMKEMIARIYTLIRAANHLPDIDPVLVPEFQSIRDNFNKSIINMWNSIEDIESQVYADYRNIKFGCDNVSGKSTADTEQRVKPNIFITNAYSVVIEKLPLLRKQLVDVREKIHIICSEIKKLS